MNQSNPRWPTVSRFRLPYREWRRLRRRAYRRQQVDQGEVCGLLVATSNRLSLVFLENLADRAGHFLMSLKDTGQAQRELRRSGRRAVGFFHSHPISPAVLSRGDIGQSPANSLQLVYDVCGREARLYRVVVAGQRRMVKEVLLSIGKSPQARRKKAR